MREKEEGYIYVGGVRLKSGRNVPKNTRPKLSNIKTKEDRTLEQLRRAIEELNRK
ncbi:MAG: hypothetical protein ACI35O_16065 [Bacillaceae bacterium]